MQESLDRQTSLQAPTVLQNVRHLTVDNRGPWEINYDSADAQSYSAFLQRFEPFNEYIRSIRNLRTLTWNAGPIPETLLSVLKASHPRATLKVFDFTRFHSYLDHLDRSELALSRSLALTHFRFSGKYKALAGSEFREGSAVDAHAQYNYDVFLAIVSRAPNLGYAGFVSQARRSETLPGEMSISHASISCSIKSLTLDGASLIMDHNTLSNLSKYIDLGKVETFKFSRGIPLIGYFQNAASYFTNIQHISLNLTALSYSSAREQVTKLDAIKGYLLRCAPLQTLSVWSWAKVVKVEDVLTRHGATLKTFQLHVKSLSGETADPKHVLTSTELKAIRESCPNLEDLTVDLTIGDVDHHLDITASPEFRAKLDEIALFEPPLRVVRLYTSETIISRAFFSDESPLEDTTDWGEKKAEMFVTAVWKYIYGTRTSGERRLEVKFGEWESWQRNFSPLDWRRFYQITPNERDDMISQCRVQCHKKW